MPDRERKKDVISFADVVQAAFRVCIIIVGK